MAGVNSAPSSLDTRDNDGTQAFSQAPVVTFPVPQAPTVALLVMRRVGAGICFDCAHPDHIWWRRAASLRCGGCDLPVDAGQRFAATVTLNGLPATVVCGACLESER